MCETFLIGEQNIELSGYRWFGNNRKLISKRACRGSGGVGILISLNLLECLNVAVISDKFEGILWVQLVHKLNKYSMGRSRGRGFLGLQPPPPQMGRVTV